MQIILNECFQNALKLLNDNDSNLFITGKAGTGKSTLLSYFTRQTKKNIVVLAPTGVAALNVKGATIHSFFRFKIGIGPQKAKTEGKKVRSNSVFHKIELIIIDEISMVRADILDSIDQFLQGARKNSIPFGGIKMAFFGDLYQLPPVVAKREKALFMELYESPYFFDANVIKSGLCNLQFVELETIYRQSDEKFIELLNSIRRNSIDEEKITLINQRHQSSFLSDEGYIYLTTTNAAADKINAEKLSLLPQKNFCHAAEITGDFDDTSFPAEVNLNIKENAQVMLLNNDPKGAWVNGSIGIVIRIGDAIRIKLLDDSIVDVYLHKWSLYKYNLNSSGTALIQEEIGSFLQYPIRLAWAITIHKSQGKTFDKVIVDFERGSFAHGQTYVALSRCRTFEGLVLKKPLKKGHILMDRRIVKFLTQFQYDLAHSKRSIKEKQDIIQKAIDGNKTVLITYLKANDEKSRRKIIPKKIGYMEYNSRQFLAISAFCLQRQEDRTFRVDRILELELI